MRKENEVVLDIQDLQLAFPRKLYFNSSLRDAFIEILSVKKKAVRSDDALVVLNGLNFKIWKGDRVGILAKNGEGKSTLCRCISGYYKPINGKIKRYGSMRALFESCLAFYPELSGRENMQILADIFFNHKTDNIPNIIEESIEFSELGTAIDAPLKTYSKGMQLRLSLSLLSARPIDLLILDEVFDGADEFFRKKISVRITELINTSSAAILVSHHENHILETCNRVLVLKDGNIIFDGNPKEAFNIYRYVK